MLTYLCDRSDRARIRSYFDVRVASTFTLNCTSLEAMVLAPIVALHAFSTPP